MDLGISGRLALVCASSKGLGFACAKALGEAGARLVINGRDEARLAVAEEELRAAGCVVNAIVADLATEKGRSELIEACPTPDILVTNNGGPAFEATVDIAREGMLSASEQKRLSAVLISKIGA